MGIRATSGKRSLVKPGNCIGSPAPLTMNLAPASQAAITISA